MGEQPGTAAATRAAKRPPPWRRLYVQVLAGLVLGVAVGAIWPAFGVSLKPLGDAFIRLIRMVIAPIVFCTVAGGIAHMSDLKKIGRIGGKALLYFELVSGLALVVGLAAAHIAQPGAGLHIDVAALDPSIAAGYVKRSHGQTTVEQLLGIIPDTFIGAFVSPNYLEVLVAAVLAGFACGRIGPLGGRIAEGLDQAGRLFFAVIGIIVMAAPLGAFGGMAFAVGMYGLGALVQLASLALTLYVASALFVAVVLGLIGRWVGFSIWRFLAYFREEILVVLGTSSTEAVMPQTMRKLERLGAAPSVVGLVVPAGYSFNLDGTCLYITLAALFLAQATDTVLTPLQELELIGVATLTSKGVSGVAGVGFVTLAATLAVVPTIPVQALAILVGVDRFLSVCRAVVSLIGNGVATLAVARWENALDLGRLDAELKRGPAAETVERHPEAPLP